MNYIYSPLDQIKNRLKKLTQVKVNIEYKQTKFGWRYLALPNRFLEILLLSNLAKISLSVYGHRKI